MSRKKVAQPSGPELPQSLYEKSEKIYPREVHGLFAFMRTTMVFVLLGLFYFMPWVSWGDNPAILFDLPARKFYIFWWTLWPQDFLYLTFLLMLAALALFFFTTLAGRLWCGYACPQTVWTELFMWIERKVEGNRGRQMKLDKAPMSVRKFRLKATKHMLWVILSLFTGFTFVAYFTPADALLTKLLTTTLGPWETFWILFYGFATYGNAGWMREQVCKYMCPYARFQSAMFDILGQTFTPQPTQRTHRSTSIFILSCSAQNPQSQKLTLQGGRRRCRHSCCAARGVSLLRNLVRIYGKGSARVERFRE